MRTGDASATGERAPWMRMAATVLAHPMASLTLAWAALEAASDLDLLGKLRLVVTFPIELPDQSLEIRALDVGLAELVGCWRLSHDAEEHLDLLGPSFGGWPRIELRKRDA